MKLVWLPVDPVVEASFDADPAPVDPVVPLELKWIDHVDAEPDGDEALIPSDYAGVGRAADRLLWIGRAAGTTNDDGTTDFIASTGAVDRAGDVLDQASWRLAAYRLNPVILYEHEEPVVGMSTKTGITTSDAGDKRLTIRVAWDTDDSNPTGVLVAHQHQAGFRHAVSVCFLPGKFQNRTDLAADHPFYVDAADTPRWRAGYFYSFCELLEVSSVAVPCNREALQLSIAARRVAETGDLLGAAKTLLHGLAPRKTAEDLVDALRADPKFKTLVLSMLLGQRQDPPTPIPTPTPNPRGLGPTPTQGPSWVVRS